MIFFISFFFSVYLHHISLNFVHKKETRSAMKCERVEIHTTYTAGMRTYIVRGSFENIVYGMCTKQYICVGMSGQANGCRQFPFNVCACVRVFCQTDSSWTASIRLFGITLVQFLCFSSLWSGNSWKRSNSMELNGTANLNVQHCKLSI